MSKLNELVEYYGIVCNCCDSFANIPYTDHLNGTVFMRIFPNKQEAEAILSDLKKNVKYIADGDFSIKKLNISIAK